MVLALAATAIAQSTTQPVLHHSQSELKQMIHEARTPEQYQALAAYFRARQRDFKEEAKAERAEWVRRNENLWWGTAMKYPRPIDSSRNRYEYFTYEADQMGQKAARFEVLSASASQAGAH